MMSKREKAALVWVWIVMVLAGLALARGQEVAQRQMVTTYQWGRDLLATGVSPLTNVVYVTSYGAIGDNATENQTTLSNAWKAVGNNGIYFLPPGPYRTSRLSLSGTVKNNYTISGKGATLLPNATNSFFLLLKGTNITFEDLTIDLDGKSAIGLYCDNGSKHWKFRNCKFLNGYADNNIDPGGTLGVIGVDITKGCSDFSFTGCVFSNFTFTLTGNVSRFVKGIFITGLGGTFPADAVKKFIIQGNFFYNILAPDPFPEGDSIEWTFPDDAEGYSVEVVNNIFDGYSWRAIKGQVGNFNIAGNILNSRLTGTMTNQAAIGVFGQGAIVDNIINGNHIKAIMVSTTGTNNGGTNVVIVGNQIYGTRVATNLTGIKLTDGATNIVVANNIVDGYYTGIGVYGDSQNIRIANNLVTHNGTGGFGILVHTNGQVTAGVPNRIYINHNSIDGYASGITVLYGTRVNSTFNDGSTIGTFLTYNAGVTGYHGFNGTLPAITTGTLDFPLIGAAASADLTIAVTGAVAGDTVSLALPAAPTAGIVFNGFVSAADTVTVRATNITGGGIDPASASYTVQVFKP